MTNETELPWDTLRATTGELPWPALNQFADGLLENPALIHDLGELYDEARAVCAETPTFADLYVAAILALAAPRLNEERRHELAPFIVQKLIDAGQADDDGAIYVLTATCGMLGPDCVPAVLDGLSKDKDRAGAWFSFWTLLKLAAKSSDPAVRDRVIQKSLELLREADRGRTDLFCAIGPAHVLAEMDYQPCRPLLQKLAARKTMPLFGPGDIKEALARLDRTSEYEPLPEMWEEPVQKWFEPRWRMAKEGYDEQDEEDEEDREDADLRRVRDLAGRFHDSQFAAELPDDCRQNAGFIAHSVLEYASTYVGVSPEELDEPALREVLLEVLPRKVTAGRELFEKFAPVTRALLRWLESEGILQGSETLAASVGRWTDQIVTEAMNPENWGMAKSLTMHAKAAGADISDPDAMRRYMAEHNLRILEQQEAREAQTEDEEEPRSYPVVNDSSHIGRNEPCPCGSGKKYKKCCGGK